MLCSLQTNKGSTWASPMPLQPALTLLLTALQVVVIEKLRLRRVPIAQPVRLWKWCLSLSLMVVLFGYRETLSSPRNRDSQTE